MSPHRLRWIIGLLFAVLATVGQFAPQHQHHGDESCVVCTATSQNNSHASGGSHVDPPAVSARSGLPVLVLSAKQARLTAAKPRPPQTGVVIRPQVSAETDSHVPTVVANPLGARAPPSLS